jgi:hypothetical protein
MIKVSNRISGSWELRNSVIQTAGMNEWFSPDISKALAPVKSTDVAVMVSRMVIEWPQVGLSLQINKAATKGPN